ncbi:RhoGAP-domain-containing protein [Martensiomyces pterosporus]|nr:RhoGAP-domain-containing protein [Martensiomyces pterosporus]
MATNTGFAASQSMANLDDISSNGGSSRGGDGSLPGTSAASAVTPTAPSLSNGRHSYEATIASATTAAAATVNTTPPPPSPRQPLPAPPTTANNARPSMSATPGNEQGNGQVDLTEIDGGLGMLLERSRQSLSSCKETVVFLKNRAKVEEEYGKSLQKLALNTLKSMDRSGMPHSTHQAAWQRLVEVHETLASNRMKFSITLSEMSEYLNSYVKEKEKVRKQLKETELRYQRTIEDAEALLEKSRSKYEMHCGEWEKLLLKSGNNRTDSASSINNLPSSTSKSKNVSNAMSGIFGKHKGSTQDSLERMGQEAGVKAKVANEAYKKLLHNANSIRRDFYDVQLPKILASVMGLIEEVDQFLKFSLGKYAYTYESAVLADALTLKPIQGGPGMVEMVGDIDTKTDLDTFLQVAASQGGRVNRDSIPYKEYEMSAIARLYANPKRIFGVSLETQLARDRHTIPLIVVKCTDAVEAFGLQNEGIYRQSGQSSQVLKLRNEFDLDAESVDLRIGSYLGDINNVTSVLKMYLRELPNGLIPPAQRDAMLSFFPADDIDAGGDSRASFAREKDDADYAAKINGLVHAIRCLPVANRNTLSFLVAHLDKVQAFQEFNMMNSENLGIVFGPTLLPAGSDPANAALDMRRSAKLVRFILDNRKLIFESP